MPPVKKSPLAFLRKLPFTLSLVVINIISFAIAWILAGTLHGPEWTSTLLRMGAQFNPLTLDKEFYRIFTHLFLHGGIIHLLANMYALIYVGYAMEIRVGTKKLAWVFFVSAMTAGLSSLYWNLFTISIGTSGAISGLFGFYLVYNIFFSGKRVMPMLILLVHFAVFAGINLVFPQQLHADYAAMYGGVITGIIIGFFSFSAGPRAVIRRVKLEYALIPILVLLYLMLPGYQVRYFKFFQQVVAAEDTTRHLIKEKLTDDDMRKFIRNYHHWDEILSRLDKQPNLPGDLASDTFKLRKYIALRKQENLLKKMVVQREAYVYLDSIDKLHEIMRKFMDLEYGLWSRIQPVARMDSSLESRMVKVFYDRDGKEKAQGPAAYYRLGIKDSLGRWNGPVREYDGEGRLRMKGNYKRNKRDGVFLYYSAEGICVEAGRYLDGIRFGKWQHFHSNGAISAEIFYNNGYFVSSVWDSTGTQLVVDGNGRETQLYPDDIVKVEGEYRHGLKEGTWYGRYSNGDMYFEEHYNQGRLVTGQSRDPAGQTFVYDESSLFPFPEGGYKKFQEYLKAETKKFNSDELGHVKLSFRITKEGSLTDLTVDQGATVRLDAKARSIILNGPRWQPARLHGHEPVDEWAFVQVEFY